MLIKDQFASSYFPWKTNFLLDNEGEFDFNTNPRKKEDTS